MKKSILLLTTVFSWSCFQTAFAAEVPRYKWSQREGLQKANNCVLNAKSEIPFFILNESNGLASRLVSASVADSSRKESLEEVSDTIFEFTDKSSDKKVAGYRLSDLLLQAAFENDDYAAVNCKEGSTTKSYALFNVFIKGQEKAVAQVALNDKDANGISQFQVQVEENNNLLKNAVQVADVSQVAALTQVATTARDPKLQKAIIVRQNELIGTQVAEEIIAQIDDSVAFQNNETAMALLPDEEDGDQVATSSCALKKIISAAKTDVRIRWGNRPAGRGLCAKGVRLSLQRSEVGDIKTGLGNAIDFISRLKGFGYIDTGIRNISKAPAGAVLVFDGPLSKQYLRTGVMRKPYGNYVGHVTIKGNDGFYYTDGKTLDPAIGWSRTRNLAKRRNLVGVMIPGNSLVQEYRNECK